MSEKKLGGGEPSSAPPAIVRQALMSANEWAAKFPLSQSDPKPDFNAAAIVYSQTLEALGLLAEQSAFGRSGAAQEVSPYNPIERKLLMICPECGSKERDPRRALSTDSKRLYLCANSWHVEEVSPPSPELTKICNDYRNDIWQGRRCDVTIDMAVQAAYELGRSANAELDRLREELADVAEVIHQFNPEFRTHLNFNTVEAIKQLVKIIELFESRTDELEADEIKAEGDTRELKAALTMHIKHLKAWHPEMVKAEDGVGGCAASWIGLAERLLGEPTKEAKCKIS